MTNEELVEQIQQGIDVQKNLGVLYEQNKNFLYYIIKPFLHYAEAEDLMQEAYIGFHEAVMSYQKIDEGAKLTTYAVWKIRKQCIRYIQGNNTKKIPVHMKQDMFKYNRFVNQYVADHGEEPSDELVCAYLQISQKKLDGIRKAMFEKDCISIHSPVPGTDESALEKIIADPYNFEEDMEERQFKEYTKKVLNEAIDDLDPRQAEIIRGTYFEEMQQSELAEQMNVSDARIGQLKRDALRKLKKMNKLVDLRDEVYGYDSKLAYSVSRKYCLDNRTSPTEVLAMKRIMLEEKQQKVQKQVDDIFAELLKG